MKLQLRQLWEVTQGIGKVGAEDRPGRKNVPRRKGQCVSVWDTGVIVQGGDHTRGQGRLQEHKKQLLGM